MQATIEKQKFGEALEDFSLQRVGGENESLAGHLEGKKGIVVLFWSSTCSHCVRYDDYLNAFEAKHPEIALVGIASRHGETIETVRKTAGERKLTFPILFDPGSLTAKKWFTQQTPRAYLLDSQRRLLYRGAVDNFKYPEDPEHIHYLEPAIRQFLSGQPISRNETASYGCAIQSIYYILPKAL